MLYYYETSREERCVGLSVQRESVEAASRGDRASQEAVLEAAWPHAFRIAKSIVRNGDVAQDVAQEACATILRTWSTLRDPNAFPAWLYRLVVRQSMVELKKVDRDRDDAHIA